MPECVLTCLQVQTFATKCGPCGCVGSHAAPVLFPINCGRKHLSFQVLRQSLYSHQHFLLCPCLSCVSTGWRKSPVGCSCLSPRASLSSLSSRVRGPSPALLTQPGRHARRFLTTLVTFLTSFLYLFFLHAFHFSLKFPWKKESKDVFLFL